VIIGLAGYSSMFLTAGALVIAGALVFAVLDGDLQRRRLPA
jgi:hypothetical protein